MPTGLGQRPPFVSVRSVRSQSTWMISASPARKLVVTIAADFNAVFVRPSDHGAYRKWTTTPFAGALPKLRTLARSLFTRPISAFTSAPAASTTEISGDLHLG